MKEPYCYLGLDIGTTGVKAVLFDASGAELGAGLAEYTLETPRPDIVELDAEVYWESVCRAVKAAFDGSAASPKQLRALSVTGQAETLIMVDRDFRPLRKVIVWLDNRAKDEAKKIEGRFGAEELFRMSGQTEMLPCWPAAKILWYRNHEPELFRRTAHYLMVEDYILHKLTGRCVSCRGLLPSTLYYDIRTGEYSPAMLDYLGIDADQLPELLDCGESAGTCIANDSYVPAGAVAAAAPLDHVCGNLGSGCSSPGVISETTGCTLALCAAFPKLVYDEEKRISTYLGHAPGSFVLLPWAPTAGMLLKHFRDEFSGGLSYRELDELAAEVAPGSDGLLLLPHCAGSVSPVCNPAARGVAYGVTLAHGKKHWARAVMESVAFLLRDNVDALRQLGAEITAIRTLGGASASALWLQIKADVLELPLAVVKCREATSLGAAILGAAARGDFGDPGGAAADMVRIARIVEPGENRDIYRECFKKYRKLNDLLLPTFGSGS